MKYRTNRSRSGAVRGTIIDLEHADLLVLTHTIAPVSVLMNRKTFLLFIFQRWK